jgi:hypothetical protein
MGSPQNQDALPEAEHTVSHRKPQHDQDAVGQICPYDAALVDVVDDDAEHLRYLHCKACCHNAQQQSNQKTRPIAYHIGPQCPELVHACLVK